MFNNTEREINFKMIFTWAAQCNSWEKFLYWQLWKNFNKKHVCNPRI